MAIVKWKFNDIMLDTLQGSYDNHINFTCNGVSYTSISTMGKPNGIYYGETQAYSWTTNKWNDIKYQYIEVDDTSTDYASFVEWAKENGGVLLEAGEYKWVDEPNLGLLEDVLTAHLDFTTDDRAGAIISPSPRKGGIITYAWAIAGDETIYFGAGSWANEAYKTITTTTDQYINYDFYTWAIAGNQLVKQTSNKITIDLTTLSGWNGVAGGTHTLQVVAKADGYKDSEKSTAIKFTK